MTTNISREEWMKALEDADAARHAPPDPSWLTLYDVSELLGLHYNTARRRLRDMVKTGKAERRTEYRQTPDERYRPVVVFRLVKAKKR